MLRRMSFGDTPTDKMSTYSRLLRDLLLLNRWLYRRRGFIWRSLLCWSIGCAILLNDESSNFDSRYQIRGNQPVDNQIVQISIDYNDLINLYKLKQFGPEREAFDISDSSYWDAEVWDKFLSEILSHQPQSVGVAFYFSDQLLHEDLRDPKFMALKNPKIVWPSSEANLDFIRDEDGVIRKFITDSTKSQFVEKLLPASQQVQNHGDQSLTKIINYRGHSKLFAKYSFKDILNRRVPHQALKNKIILIGPDAHPATQYLTPLGPNQRLEVLSQILDNHISNRWIQRAPMFIYMLFLFLLMLLAVMILNRYPQTVALFLLIWVGTLLSALSIWIFDSWYFWIPMAAPVIQIFATYVIFLEFQANKIERQHWQLKQDQKNLLELETLKNNFVSLISHDLKTPIAKIQAILDRLTMKKLGPEVESDLQTLKQSSDELNKYIQSILKLLRVESRDFRLNPEVGDINEIIQEAVKQLQPLAIEKNMKIQVELEPMFSIEADFTLMREVLVNLIDNAIKYSKPNGKIQIKSLELDNEVRVEITDDGAGIPADELHLVWGKFVRGRDQDLKTRGTGLGLYLVKFFIELHGGKVGIESELQKGTKVYFSLPVEMGNA